MKRFIHSASSLYMNTSFLGIQHLHGKQHLHGISKKIVKHSIFLFSIFTRKKRIEATTQKSLFKSENVRQPLLEKDMLCYHSFLYFTCVSNKKCSVVRIAHWKTNECIFSFIKFTKTCINKNLVQWSRLALTRVGLSIILKSDNWDVKKYRSYWLKSRATTRLW